MLRGGVPRYKIMNRVPVEIPYTIPNPTLPIIIIFWEAVETEEFKRMYTDTTRRKVVFFNGYEESQTCRGKNPHRVR